MTWEECAAAGMTTIAAAEARGMTENAARDYARRHDIKFAPYVRPSKLDFITREMLEPIWNNRSIRLHKVAERLEVHYDRLLVRGHGLGLPSRVCRHPIDDDLFRYLWDYGVSGKHIGVHFGYKGSKTPHDKAKLLGLKPKGHNAPRNTPTVAEALQARLGERMKCAK